MQLEIRQAYEICWVRDSVHIRYCFVEMVNLLDGRIECVNQFRPCLIHTNGGTIQYREDMKPRSTFDACDYDYALVEIQPWMQLRLSDVLWAVQVCEEVSEPLPKADSDELPERYYL